MGYWEEQYIWANNPFGANLVLFVCYIDDIVIIWDGTKEELLEFVNHCQNNPYGIKFTNVIDETSLVFLDLELYHDPSGKIQHKTHFKPTSGNSYFHAHSAHHRKWLSNIPEGQFSRLRRTCSKESDYQLLGTTLKQKFLDKGYSQDHIENTFQKHKKIIPGKEKNSETNNNFITSFCT